MIHGIHIAPLKTFTLPPAPHTNCYVLGTDELIIVDPLRPVHAEDVAAVVAEWESWLGAK